MTDQAAAEDLDLHLHLSTIPPWINDTFFILATLIAAWRGDGRARAISSASLVAVGFGALVCHTWPCWGPARPALMAWRGLTEDLPILAVCLACAWRAERYWVLWASSFAVLNLTTDLMEFIMPGISAWAYGSAGLVCVYGLYATVLIGVWPSVRRAAAAAAIAGDG